MSVWQWQEIQAVSRPAELSPRRQPADDAVDLMLAIAAGELDETAVAAWLTKRLQPIDT